MNKEKQTEEMAKREKCEKCIHSAVCQELEEHRDPLGFISTKDEWVCSYYEGYRKAGGAERERGEWLTDRYGMERSICSGCGAVYEDDGGNFCRNCGRDMRKED